MEFLVRIRLNIPPSVSPSELEELTRRERIRGRELQASGHIQRIWRVKGTTGNVGIWQAEDAAELHEVISSLPLFGYMTIETTALTVHPLES